MDEFGKSGIQRRTASSVLFLTGINLTAWNGVGHFLVILGTSSRDNQIWSTGVTEKDALIVELKEHLDLSDRGDLPLSSRITKCPKITRKCPTPSRAVRLLPVRDRKEEAVRLWMPGFSKFIHPSIWLAFRIFRPLIDRLISRVF